MTTPLVEWLDAFDALPWSEIPERIHSQTQSGAQEFYILVRKLREYRNDPIVSAALNAQRTAEA